MICSFLIVAAAVGTAEGFENYAIPSWGDYVCAFGPGTDPAMDSAEALQHMIEHWRGRGFTGVCLRTDLVHLEPGLVRRNRVYQPNPRLAALWKYVDDVMERFDPYSVGPRLCERRGFQFWAWHPHLYSDGAPQDAGTPGPGRMVPWPYVSTYTFAHPEAISADRRGNRLWMVREYAYPEARATKVAEFVQMAKRYGVKRFIACMRSEVSQLQDPPDRADRYGFNEPVVRDMQRLHGVDIMTDPRFDVDRPGFDPRDPMVQRWHDLRGQYVTQLFRELRQALHAVDPKIRIAATLSGEYAGPPLGNFRLDWRRWVDEGLVDEIITPVFFEATLDHQADRKGYLTNVRAGKGTVSFATLRAHIAHSPHPEVKLISSGAHPYFPVPPPTGADGWRSDIWYDSYHIAWYQRWEQWKRDLAEFGHIKFFAQDFDSVEEKKGTAPFCRNGPEGASHKRGLSPFVPGESWGLQAYSPKLRACPGCWYPLGDGRDGRAAVQEAVRRGDHGRAVRLFRTVEGKGGLTAWHNSGPDRSTLTGQIDNAITNGRCRLEFWLYRASPASGLAAYLQSDGGENDVGLRVTGPTGRVLFSNGGRWIASDYAVPVGRWERLTIAVDLDAGRYSAHAGEDGRVTLCRDVPYQKPKARFVEQSGVNIPIPVPAYKMFRLLNFVPEGELGAATYLDDVALDWTPTLHYQPPGKQVWLADDFESRPDRSPISAARGWSVAPPAAARWFVENGTSFGRGVRCARTSGGAELVVSGPGRLDLDHSERITVDLDLFLRSDSPFAPMIPNPLTKSPHRTAIVLRGSASGTIVAAAAAGDGVWRYWDGDRYVASGVRIAYDVWNHLQIALDVKTGQCRLVVQPVGEMPTPIGHGRIGQIADRAEPLGLAVSPSATKNHLSCCDNVVIAQTPASPAPAP